MAKLSDKQLAKLTPAERKKRAKLNEYKKAYHAARKAKHEGSKTYKRQYHARKKAEKEVAQTVLDRVEVAVAELKVTEAKREALMLELREIFAQK